MEKAPNKDLDLWIKRHGIKTILEYSNIKIKNIVMIKNDNYIALSSICKENIDDIIEWIIYHRDIGVDAFILYNNDPEMHLYDLLPKELQSICVVKDWFLEKNGRQILAQKDCIKHYNQFRWIGFLDIDEYIVLLDESTNIKDYLVEYDQFDGLCLHWLLFGSNNHTAKQKSTIFSYTQSCPSHGANEHIKSIINPNRYSGKHSDPHFIPTIGGNVNTLCKPVKDAFGSTRNTKSKPVISSHMRINHYYTKSIEDFEKKKNRGGGNMVNRKYTDDHFNGHQNENVYNDDIIRSYLKLKKNNNDNNN